MAVSFLFRRIAPALVPGVLLVACGARGPLDITVIEEAPGDGGSDGALVEASVDASDAGDGGESARDAEEQEAAGFDGGPLVNCATCVGESCGQQLITCVTDTNCLNALQCVATTCIGSGGLPDPTCIETCTNGDSTALGDLIGAFTCILTSCGSSCTSVLGGLGGGGGAGGGAGSGAAEGGAGGGGSGG